MFFGLIAMLALAAMGAAVALVASYILLLPLQLSITPKGPNRYGAASSTRDLGGAISGGFRRAFDFSGRANRLDFWVFAFTVGALCFVAFVAFVVAAFVCTPDSWPWIALPLAVIPLLAIPSLSMAVRR
ncbi:MAG: DUF805 domain-containing protein, partial [Asticcacaulis sp.]|nr:DUF805 domain-containing protein [Asticcacaulis sp.]